jgi:diguanylate cyclase (GGDEF)-like protein/PAS domain S-box-containing protein
MARLADNDLSIKFNANYRVNELLDTMRALMVFRDNMAKQHKTEKQLTNAYDAMSKQLDELHNMRERSEIQTSKALSLAEGMAAARESAEQAKSIAEEERHRVRSILDGVRDAIITINTHGIIESVNPATETIFGYQEIEMIGKNISMLMSESMRSQHDIYIERFVQGHAKRAIVNPYEQTAQRKDGTSITVDVTLNTMTIANELKIMGVLRDITKHKQWENEIKRLAMTDPLTGLANRNHYTLRLEGAAALSKRNKQPFALLLIDLDKFKPVNDTYGHAIGDALLQHVAQTLINCCREVDTIARLGGDEFAIILVPTENDIDAVIPAQRIIDQLSQQVLIEEHTITIGASIGISYYPTNSSDIEELQRQADAALYQAKESGRSTYHIFQNSAGN